MVQLQARTILTTLLTASVVTNYWSARPRVGKILKFMALVEAESAQDIALETEEYDEKKSNFDFSKEDVTIIITTNLIPTSPGIMVVNETIRSLPKFLHGLSETAPLIIAVDGLDKKTRMRESNADERYTQYVKNLRQEFHRPYETVLPQTERINLIGNLQEAIAQVQTEFVYIIQHDMPFLKDVNHTALIKTFREHPDTIKMVRFNYIRRHADKFNNCDEKEINFEANGIQLTKHHVWSDNNHLTRKSYYEELWTFMNRSTLFMEFDMRDRAWKNCSYWGTHLYGPRGNFNVIGHLDGRFYQGNSTFAKERWHYCKEENAKDPDCGR